MYLSYLEVTQLRNLQSLQIEPHPEVNFIVGANGSGKTSLLESIALLSRGRSFRTPNIKKVISNDCSDVTVFGVIHHGLGTSDSDRVGIRRTGSGETLVKVNGERCERLSDLALLMPAVEIEASSFEFIDGGPSLRRELMDWGLFHVEHSFLEIWKRYRNALEQKNALLKGHDPKFIRHSLPHWNQQLAEYGELLNSLRLKYFNALVESLDQVTQRYLQIASVGIKYHPGWNTVSSGNLADCLTQNIDAEIEKGRSIYGPHRADLEFLWEGRNARDICSRGQKKLVLYAVRLAQVLLFHQKKNIAPLLLLDDLPAELDKSNIERISRFLSDYPCQSFITAIDKDIKESGLLMTFGSHKMFHVEHGQLIHTS